MTSLPIVERELRVAARRPGTYRTRMLNAVLATLAFAVCFVASLIDPSLSFADYLFWGLAGLCMLYCLAAGRMMTADCLSREKREGTFGLLFLTDLKGYDVVLGKLAATSLNGFYGLVAIFPVLALPLMAGGLTKGELWRMALVLANTFLLSAAVGLFASAISRDERKVMGVNLGLLLWLAAIPPACAAALKMSMPGLAAPQGWFYSCPIYSFWQCADTHYKTGFEDFWWSIGVTFGLTVALLAAACFIAPRAWQDKAPRARTPQKAERRRRCWRDGSLATANAFRRRLLDKNAYLWLAARPYVKSIHVWIFLSVVACWWVVTSLVIGNVPDELNVVLALLVNSAIKLWITTEAGQQLANDKKSGAFELLLSTPLRSSDIVRGQWMALRRQFLKPLAAVVIAESFFMLSVNSNDQLGVVWVAGIVILGADAITLGWLAMLNSLTSKTHARANINAASAILLLPWGLFLVVEVAAHLFMFLFYRPSWNPDWQFNLGWWFGVCIVVDIYYTVKARRRLRLNFQQLVMEAAAPKRCFAWVWDLRVGIPERKAALRLKYRRAAIVAVLSLVVGKGLYVFDNHVALANVPKPVVISITRSNNPTQVVRSQNNDGFLFILPDGTLWVLGGLSDSSPPRQLGTNRDWTQVSFSMIDSAIGLRTNGTIWTWAVNAEAPKQFGSDQDWAQVCTGDGSSFARKRDGTLWGWGNNSKGRLGNGPGPNRAGAERIGTNSDWQSIGANYYGFSSIALRSNGTLWAWGIIDYVKKGGSWNVTNCQFPIQLCQETNWVGFDDPGFLRNRAGELWNIFPLTGLPGGGVPIKTIGQLLSTNAAMTAMGPVYTTNWCYGKYELAKDGTLWATPESMTPYLWQLQAASLPAPPRSHIGSRSDWVGVWGSQQTMIGMTADRTLWIWGMDYGQESHWTQLFTERLRQIKRTFGFVVGRKNGMNYRDYVSDRFPPQKEPRPLMRLEDSRP